MEKPVKEWCGDVQVVLESKVNEFHLMGYSRTTKEDLWHCLVENVWKGNPEKRLHEIVRDIYHLKPMTYMNYLTMKTYEDDDLMSSIAALTEG